MTKVKEDSAIRKELQHLLHVGRGVLKPEAVIEFARDATTALHSQFNWDDTEAAHRWRLHQAMNLIRVQVTFEPRVEKKMRVYVSLPADRAEEGGGYRRMIDVLSSADRRAQLLQMALDELAVFQQKYATISELAEVFAAAQNVRETVSRKSKGRKVTAKSIARRTA